MSVFTNLTHDELDNEIMKFSKNLKQYDIVCFYYSGHANQQTLDDQITDNFLFGIDAKTEKREGGKEVTRGIPLMDRIIYRWFNEKCIYLMILDACRKYATTKTHQFKFKEGTNSKLPHELLGSPTMTLMVPGLRQELQYRQYDFVFACQPGKGAIEDDTRSSGYLAAALSTALSKPGTWTAALRQVMKQVETESNYQQEASVTMNVTQEIYFVPKIIDNYSSLNLDATGSTSSSSLPISLPYPPNNFDLQMPQKIFEPNLNNLNLEITTIDQLKNFIENGSLINKVLEISDKILSFEVSPKSFVNKIFIKGVKIVASFLPPNSCEALHIKLQPGQKIQIQDCIFKGVGLKIECKKDKMFKMISSSGGEQSFFQQISQQSQNLGFLENQQDWTKKLMTLGVSSFCKGMATSLGDIHKQNQTLLVGNSVNGEDDSGLAVVVINQVKICDAPKFGFELINLESVHMTKIITQNCSLHGIQVQNVADVLIQFGNICQSELGLLTQDCENFYVKNVEVENCSKNAFEFRNSVGKIADCRYRNCFNGVADKNQGGVVQKANVVEV